MLRIIRFPLVWLAIGAFLVVAAVESVTVIFGESGLMGTVVAPLVASALAITLYWLVMRWVANRITLELSPRRLLADGLSGVVIGVVYVVISVGLISALGSYKLDFASVDVTTILSASIATNVGIAVFEELLFRGLLLQAIEKLGGRWIALITTSLIFGVAHLLSAGATLWTAAAVVLEAGVLLGAAFLWRRSLWFVIGIHFALNTTQDLLGLPGSNTQGIFETSSRGSDLISGGAGGFGASIVTVCVGIALTIPLILLARRKAAGVEASSVRADLGPSASLQRSTESPLS